MSIQVNSLTKTYDQQQAVDHISFEIAAGQVVGLLGPNGAGKSTTMKMLTCFLPPTSGSAKICGYDTNEESMAVREKIGYLPEHNPLYPEMYVAEYLAFASRFYPGRIKNKKQRIAEMIEVTGLTAERKKRIGQLSKGYQQRVGIAQAMLHDPEVLILDEPTSGLDPNQLVEIRALIKKLGAEKTVMLSTHIMQEVQAICDRVIIINQGKIVADDTTQNLQKRATGQRLVMAEFKQTDVRAEKLAQIKHVKSVSRNGDLWVLATDADKDIREQVFEFAKDNHLVLLTLQQEKHSLEEVFQQLTTH